MAYGLLVLVWMTIREMATAAKLLRYCMFSHGLATWVHSRLTATIHGLFASTCNTPNVGLKMVLGYDDFLVDFWSMGRVTFEPSQLIQQNDVFIVFCHLKLPRLNIGRAVMEIALI